MIKRMIPAAVVAVAAVATFAATPAQAVTTYRAGSCTASGAFGICSFDHGSFHPKMLTLHVGMTPRQHVAVNWELFCSSKRQGSFASRSGSFTVTRSTTRTMRHPFTAPHDCDVSVVAQMMDGPGRIHVWATYTRWH
jgi:hypothetical protein